MKVAQQGGSQLTIGLLNALIASPGMRNLVPLLLSPSLSKRMFPRAVSCTVLSQKGQQVQKQHPRKVAEHD